MCIVLTFIQLFIKDFKEIVVYIMLSFKSFLNLCLKRPTLSSKLVETKKCTAS